MLLSQVVRAQACLLWGLTVFAPGFARAAEDAGAAARTDAAACAALAADAGRLGTKFTLGREACAQAAAPSSPAATPRARQAQQLYLYETPLEPELSAPAISSTAVQRRPVKTPSRTISQPTPVERALRLSPVVDAVARAHDIDPLLLHAMARVESRHDPHAVSPAGARGVMQVMPATAARFGVSGSALHHAPTNLQVGAVYLKSLQQRFGGELPLVLAAYNAGEGAVERHGNRIPPFAETRGYVRDVLAEYQRLRAAQQAVRTPSVAVR